MFIHAYVITCFQDDSNATEIISYWHPNLTLNMVYDQTPWQRGSLPAPLNECEPSVHYNLCSVFQCNKNCLLIYHQLCLMTQFEIS